MITSGICEVGFCNHLTPLRVGSQQKMGGMLPADDTDVSHGCFREDY